MFAFSRKAMLARDAKRRSTKAKKATTPKPEAETTEETKKK